MGSDTLIKLAKVEDLSEIEIKTILHRINSVMKKLDIPFWYATGTALGLARDGKLMPWDMDIDFECWDTAYSKINALLETVGEQGFTLQSIHRYKNRIEQIGWTYQSSKGPFLVDVTFKHQRGTTAWCTSKDEKDGIIKWVNKAYPIGLFIAPKKHLVYDDLMVDLPDPVSEYLELNYGPDWQEPQPDFWEKHGYYSHRACIRENWDME